MEFTQVQLIKEKLDLIKKVIYPDTLSIPVWRTRTATYKEAIVYENYSDWSEMTLGTAWTVPYDGARWFEATVTVPESYAGKRVVLELDLGGEGIVSINGQIKSSLAHFKAASYSALIGTLRHRTRVDITDCAKGGEVLNISIQLNMNYKDHFRGNRFVRYNEDLAVEYLMAYANLCTVDEASEGYYFDAQNLYDAIQLLYSPADTAMNSLQTVKIDLQFDRMLRNMNRDAALRSRMILALQKSMTVIPFFYPPEQMRQAMPEAAEILREEMQKLPKSDRGTVYATGFGHLDLVWLWQQKHSVRKTANTLANALALIERYPEFTFTFSQPCAFQWLEEFYPELFEKVRQKIVTGQIDPIGNLWVEMDTNLAGGEAIVRQLLYGRAYYLEKFGRDSDVFFMPDSFGYAASLPQIIAKSGVKYFYTNKLQVNEHYRFPHTFFLWQGIDGTRIPGYVQRCAYSGCLNCERVDETYHRNEDKRYIDAAFITCGYGDGGGGADYVMVENGRRLQDMPGLPKVKFGTMSQFFREVTANAGEFPVWNDELYLDCHRGTLTSQGSIKKNNRKAELAMRATEIAASMRQLLLGIAYPAAQIEALWKQLLFLQFHDSLPGSSNTFVNQDIQESYGAFFREQEALHGQLLADLTAAVPHENGQTVNWNFLSWDRQGIPAMGWAITEPARDTITVTPTHMENKFFVISLDEKGQLTGVLHKKTGRQVLKETSNVLEIFEDPAKGNLSAWDIHPEYNNVREVIDHVQSIQVLRCDARQGVLRIVRKHHNSTFTQDITIYADVERIDFVTHVDWHETMRLLKAAFYPNVHASRASYEIQFGTIERPTHRNTDYDAMRFESCAHKWADLSQNDFGVSLLNDCKYGYDICDGKMRITLLRAGVEPDYLQDQGEHSFTYSLYPHPGTWADGGTVRAGYELNVPVEQCVADAGDARIACSSFIRVEGSNAVLDTVKRAEDGRGYILRLYEACGGGGQITVNLPMAAARVTACDLMENDEAPVAVSGSRFTFETAPYCIHSFRVEF